MIEEIAGSDDDIKTSGRRFLMLGAEMLRIVGCPAAPLHGLEARSAAFHKR